MMYRLAFLHRMYHWTLGWVADPRAAWALFFIAFIESSFFLIPPDVLLGPMVLARPRRWIEYAAITTAGSVLGGIAGYLIGIGLWESVGQAIVRFYGVEEALGSIRNQFEAHAFFTIFTAAFTPIPYKVITIASGLFQVGLPVLVVASIIGRGLRFFMLAGLIGFLGDKIKEYIERYFDLITIIFLMLLVGGFVVLQWLV